MRVISAEEQRNSVDMNEIIEYAAVALKEFAEARTVMPICLALPFNHLPSLLLPISSDT